MSNSAAARLALRDYEGAREDAEFPERIIEIPGCDGEVELGKAARFVFKLVPANF